MNNLERKQMLERESAAVERLNSILAKPSSSIASCSTENRQSPYFERRAGENVALVTESLNEFGETQKTRRLLSEKTAKRLLIELADLL